MKCFKHAVGSEQLQFSALQITTFWFKLNNVEIQTQWTYKRHKWWVDCPIDLTRVTKPLSNQHSVKNYNLEEVAVEQHHYMSIFLLSFVFRLDVPIPRFAVKSNLFLLSPCTKRSNSIPGKMIKRHKHVQCQSQCYLYFIARYVYTHTHTNIRRLKS